MTKKPIFNIGDVRHLEFNTFHFWSCGCRLIRNLVCPPNVHQILSKSNDFSPIYGDITIFKMAEVRHIEFVVTS